MFKKLTKFSLNHHSQHSGDTRSCEEQIKDVCGRVAAHRSDKMAAVTLSYTVRWAGSGCYKQQDVQLKPNWSRTEVLRWWGWQTRFQKETRFEYLKAKQQFLYLHVCWRKHAWIRQMCEDELCLFTDTEHNYQKLWNCFYNSPFHFCWTKTGRKKWREVRKTVTYEYKTDLKCYLF